MQIKLNNILPIPLKEKLLQKYSDIWNTDCAFSQQEWIKIKAPSGSGKTTLIHILYKLRADYEGQVFWNNNNLKNINGNDLATLRQQNISIIFQDLRLFSQLTARENIELKRVLQKPVYESGKIDEMAEKLGITHVLNQKAGICSYGEQQRIAIIRALMQPFDWLLMDEPFSHLDQKNIRIASALIAEECVKRKAGIFLTDLDDDAHFNYTKYLNL
ncbi:MAG: ATP-binding cassette domain-containing protein [Chitinophagaceae bacterium]|jgi:putative ABC transport system ATP-binding protein|nr:ATP-binding cassette domain-containing protein [Chitinophagaceae bacterium]